MKKKRQRDEIRQELQRWNDGNGWGMFTLLFVGLSWLMGLPQTGVETSVLQLNFFGGETSNHFRVIGLFAKQGIYRFNEFVSRVRLVYDPWTPNLFASATSWLL
jgi:hypothetical protein